MADLNRASAFSLEQVPKRPNLHFECRFWDAGLTCVAGLDEAGRGALAGPVVAGAVVLHPKVDHSTLLDAGVRDSKKLSPQRRVQLFDLICDHAEAWSYGLVSAPDIDAMGIVPATLLAMTLAIRQLVIAPQALVIDYMRLPNIELPQASIVRGDSVSLSVAAASIVAKVTRDRMLLDLEDTFPGYGFARHKGYGTALHRQALATLGPCSIHRRSFRPVAEVIES